MNRVEGDNRVQFMVPMTRTDRSSHPVAAVLGIDGSVTKRAW